MSLARWLLLKDYGRSTDSVRLEGNTHLDTVCNFDKRNSFVHPVVFTVKGHCSFDSSFTRALTFDRKRQFLLFRYAAYGKVAVENEHIGTSLFNLSRVKRDQRTVLDIKEVFAFQLTVFMPLPVSTVAA